MRTQSKMKTLLIAAALTAVSGTAMAGTLQNLERERAIMIETMLSPNQDAAGRQESMAVSKHRMVDLERMVLRDKSLVGKNTPAVRKAFANYDLTFLVHASVEKNLGLMDHWMEHVGVSTHTLMSGRVGRR